MEVDRFFYEQRLGFFVGVFFLSQSIKVKKENSNSKYKINK